MKKEDLKPYFEAHPNETELYLIGTQVYMGSQKVHAQNYANTEKVKLDGCKHTRESIMGKSSAK